MKEVGGDPGREARCVEARHIDLDSGLIVFPPSEANGTNGLST